LLEPGTYTLVPFPLLLMLEPGTYTGPFATPVGACWYIYTGPLPFATNMSLVHIQVPLQATVFHAVDCFKAQLPTPIALVIILLRWTI